MEDLSVYCFAHQLFPKIQSRIGCKVFKLIELIVKLLILVNLSRVDFASLLHILLIGLEKDVIKFDPPSENEESTLKRGLT